MLSIGYDFRSEFPYDKLTEKHPVLGTIRKNLVREYEYYSFYVKKGKKGNTAEGLNYLIVRTSCNLSRFAFRTGFDVIMNYEKSGACVIIINPKYKKDYSLSSIYIKVNRSEKDNWKLWKGNLVLRTEKTAIPREEIEKYLKEYILAI